MANSMFIHVFTWKLHVSPNLIPRTANVYNSKKSQMRIIICLRKSKHSVNTNTHLWQIIRCISGCFVTFFKNWNHQIYRKICHGGDMEKVDLNDLQNLFKNWNHQFYLKICHGSLKNNCVQNISLILFEMGMPYLVCGCILGWCSVMYHLPVTVTISLTFHLVFRIVIFWSISLFEVGIPNLVCKCILEWRIVLFHFLVTVTLTSDLVSRIGIKSGA